MPLKATKKQTKRIMQKNQPKKDTAKEAPLRHFHSPQELTWQAKNSIRLFTNINRIKTSVCRREKTKDSDEPHVTKNSESPSELHLHAILRDEYEKIIH
ncbi:MAG: hypothetical protein HWD59_08060 [Coxiellaceae bacterium]|nr:MAG: hypothetical protein HWD59_08060 [Coxiellaceae bacterium]